MDGRAYYKLSDGKLIGVSNRTDRKSLVGLMTFALRVTDDSFFKAGGIDRRGGEKINSI